MNPLILKSATIKGRTYYADQLGNVYYYRWGRIVKVRVGDYKEKYLNPVGSLKNHIIVAACWLGPRPEGMQIDHINRNTHDNRPANLRYVTPAENSRNRHDNYIVFERHGKKWRRTNKVLADLGRSLTTHAHRNDLAPFATINGKDYCWKKIN